MLHINKYWIPLIFLFYICFIGCKKLVATDPPASSLTTLSAFSDNSAAIAVMTGHFTLLSQNDASFTNLTSVSRFTGLSSDELVLRSGISDISQIAYYRNELYSSISGSVGGECWPYNYIYSCNVVIEGLNASNSLNVAVKKQLMGEAKFMRAFYFFYLVNLYGDIPMPLSTDVEINRQLPRAPKSQVYQQIIADLKESQTNLSSDFLDGGLRPYLASVATERVRPTKWAALALLARTYLYAKEYENAELIASTVIGNTTQFSLVNLNNVFKANSREAIWQLQPVNAGRNTGEGAFYALTAAGPTTSRPVYLSSSLLNSFEVGDSRRVLGNWINSVTALGIIYYYPYKYKLGISSTPGSEYTMMLRLGEQYLIRAEARTHLGNVNGARDDLFAIRRRAGLADASLAANDQASLLTAILHERQVELFTEWGHRWFDLKRTGNIDAVMSVETPKKGGTWQTTDQLYPLRYDDMQRDQNLTQNPGY